MSGLLRGRSRPGELAERAYLPFAAFLRAWRRSRDPESEYTRVLMRHISRRLLSVASLVLATAYPGPHRLAAAPQEREKTAPRSSEAERLEYALAHYTKYEHSIPMRDGVRLFTAVHVPKDASQTFPILLTRTPYTVSPYGADSRSPYGASLEQFSRRGSSSPTRTCGGEPSRRASSSTSGPSSR